MRLIKTESQFNEFQKILSNRSLGYSSEIINSVTEIINQIKSYGDSALLKYTQKFDRNNSDTLKIPQDTINEYAQKVDSNFTNALKISATRIRDFHNRQIEKSWQYETNGTILGQILRPLNRVGVYVPGGKAAYPSTVLMNVIPAQVAGVNEIALCVPTPDGIINPHVMAAIKMLNIQEVYAIGGAQAVAALAYGTQTIHAVDKIVGPGNVYVALAKKMVFGVVDIDMIAGPSEILIIADDKADPIFIAADMLSQAEHDEMASSIVISNSQKIIDQTINEVNLQLNLLTRKEIAEKSINNFGAIIKVNSLDQAFEYSNLIAPEHLEIMTEEPMNKLPLIKNAGAIFLGKWTPEPLGDYSAGPNHTLPTGGTSRFFSPLGVYDFIKRSSLLYFTEQGFKELAPIVETIANTEGLNAHANTIKIRNL
ncbi:MAG: histidinol dehydrogenase [Nitrospirae bacterium]|nr:histidinol dehydrogenase [Nitrospirota bacterium]